MIKHILELDNLLKKYIGGEINGTELSNFTLEVIAQDKFEEIDNSVQDAIYALDNKELNNLSDDEILSIKVILENYINSSLK